MVYQGTTNFGFFSASALANQKGIRGAAERIFRPEPSRRPAAAEALIKTAPRHPADADRASHQLLTLPAGALAMIDIVTDFDPEGGPSGLGFVTGTKRVDPEEWFFKAHFYQDPVCPGSLGIESLIQLVKFTALKRWPHLVSTHRFEALAGSRHEWIYRGQVIPANREVTVTAVITRAEEGPSPSLAADGWLAVDGLVIYEMKGFGVRLVATEAIL